MDVSDEQKPTAHEMDQAALLQVIAQGTQAQNLTMRAVQGMVDTMRPLIENLQEERHEQRAITQQLIAESQQTREELRQGRALQAKLLEALQARQAPAQHAPSQADNAQAAAANMPGPAASGGAMHAPTTGGTAAAAAGAGAAAAGDAAAEEGEVAVVLRDEGIVKYRLKKGTFMHYVGGRLHQEPHLHLGTLRRLAPKLLALEEVERKGGKISRDVLKKARIPLEEWPVMLNTRGDRLWMTVSKARRAATI